jgi:hypothetical protein
MTDISLATMLHVMDSIVHYNCLGEVLLKIIKDLDEFINRGETRYLCPFEILKANRSSIDDDLQIIWMSCVCQFGSYGASPRGGWIEDLEGCRKYLLAITTSYRRSEEGWCDPYGFILDIYLDPIDVWKSERGEIGTLKEERNDSERANR